MSWVSKSVFSADGGRSSVEVWYTTLDTVCEKKDHMHNVFSVSK